MKSKKVEVATQAQDPLEAARRELAQAIRADAAALRVAARGLEDRLAAIEDAKEAHRAVLRDPDPYNPNMFRANDAAAVQGFMAQAAAVRGARGELLRLHREFPDILGGVDKTLTEGATPPPGNFPAQTQNALWKLRRLEAELTPPEPQRPTSDRTPNPLPR